MLGPSALKILRSEGLDTIGIVCLDSALGRRLFREIYPSITKPALGGAKVKGSAVCKTGGSSRSTT